MAIGEGGGVFGHSQPPFGVLQTHFVRRVCITGLGIGVFHTYFASQDVPVDLVRGYYRATNALGALLTHCRRG